MSTTSTGISYSSQIYVGAANAILVSISTDAAITDNGMDAVVLGIQQAVEGYLNANGIPFSAGPLQKLVTTAVDYTGDVAVTPPVWQ